MDPDAVARRLIRAEAARRRNRRIRAGLKLLQVGFDMICALLAFVVAYYVREVFPLGPLPPDPPGLWDFYLPTIILHVGSVLIAAYFSRLYHQPRAASRFDVAYRILGAVSLAVFMSVAFQTMIFKNSPLETDYPRSLLIYVWFFSVVFIILGRELHNQIVFRLRARGIARDDLLIVGEGEAARYIIQKIEWSPQLGFDLAGLVTETGRGSVLGIQALGRYEDLPVLIDELEIDIVIIALPEVERRQLVNLVTLCQRGQVDIKVYPDVFAYMAGSLSVDDLGGLPLLNVRDVALRGWNLSIKRMLDFIGAAVGLVALSPLMLAIALLIKRSSPGPVFFYQYRMGLDGKMFPVIKYRTMRPDAEKDGPGWTVENDPRVTPIGRILRRTNLDELPQLINVLFGQMSLVGPRPEQEAYVRQFRQFIPRYMERHQMKAGMTGWAQVNGLRGDTSVEERTKYDLWYVENWSLWLDIKILIRTVIQTLRGSSPNAY
ncbi:MAG: undecaprenyl-phosphate glucose phosphotransferase [Anaerolineae bacterium]